MIILKNMFFPVYNNKNAVFFFISKEKHVSVINNFSRQLLRCILLTQLIVDRNHAHNLVALQFLKMLYHVTLKFKSRFNLLQRPLILKMSMIVIKISKNYKKTIKNKFLRENRAFKIRVISLVQHVKKPIN